MIRLDEIAKRVGVSRATVSRAINGSPLVNRKTADKIRQAMDEMGFDRTALRPGPRSRPADKQQLRIGTLALVVLGATGDVLHDPGMATVIEAAQLATRKRGINLILDEMSSPAEIPLCVRKKQVDGVLLFAHPDFKDIRDEYSRRIAQLIPAVQLLGPAHSVPEIDHISVNDITVGDLAFQTLLGEGCQSMVVVQKRTVFHEALFVRGRAFLDRCRDEGIPARVLAAPVEERDPAGYWPQPATILSSLDDLPNCVADLPAPTGIFLTIQNQTREVNSTLSKAGLLRDNRCRLLVAGNTPAYVGHITPKPLTIEIPFHKILAIAVDRLIYCVCHRPPEGLTFLVPPHLL